MDQITLKKTRLTVSRACFGAMTFGSQVDEGAAEAILGYCFEQGINFIDTANVYNAGASETILGRLLKGRRQQVVLASKVRGKMGPGPEESGLSRSAILHAVEGSLRRLQTDYLDLYYLHQPDWAVPLEESLDALDTLVRQGKVRYPACSNYAGWQVARMLWIAERQGYEAARVTQPMYNLIARGIEQEYLAMAKELSVSTVVYNPLAGGLLTGKQRRDKPIEGTRFDGNRMYLDRYWHDADFDAVDALASVAERAGRSLVSLALNWILHHTPADCLLLGASRHEQLKENLKAMEDGPLPQDAVEACDEIWKRLRGVTPQYNR